MGDDEVEFDERLLVEFVELPLVELPLGDGLKVMGIAEVRVTGWRSVPRETTTENEVETTTGTLDDEALLLCHAVRGSGTSV